MLFYAREPKRLDSASPLPFFFFFFSFDIDDDGLLASRPILLPCCCCPLEMIPSVEVTEGIPFVKGSSWRAIATPLSWFVRSLERLVFGCDLVLGMSTERGERAV